MGARARNTRATNASDICRRSFPFLSRRSVSEMLLCDRQLHPASSTGTPKRSRPFREDLLLGRALARERYSRLYSYFCGSLFVSRLYFKKGGKKKAKVTLYTTNSRERKGRETTLYCCTVSILPLSHSSL